MIRSLTAAGAVLLLLGGCNSDSVRETGIAIQGNWVRRIEVDGHSYLTLASGIVHNEACPNPIHQCPPCP